MNKKKERVLRMALYGAISAAINEVGMDDFKKTSLFLSSEKGGKSK